MWIRPVLRVDQCCARTACGRRGQEFKPTALQMQTIGLTAAGAAGCRRRRRGVAAEAQPKPV